MRIRSLFVSLFLLLIAISFGHTYRSDGGTVLINEQPVFTLKSSLDGYTPSERAFMIVNTLTDGAIKLPLTIRAARTGTWLYAGSTRVVRITPAEAKAQGAATTELLRKWKQSIEAAYALPPIKASETTTSLGVGATTMVSLYFAGGVGLSFISLVFPQLRRHAEKISATSKSNSFFLFLNRKLTCQASLKSVC